MIKLILIILVLWIIVSILGFDDSEYGWGAFLLGIVFWLIGTVIYLGVDNILF